MPQYRIYEIDGTGHIAGPAVTVTCDDDHAALENALARLDGSLLEVWEGVRLLARLAPNEIQRRDTRARESVADRAQSDDRPVAAADESCLQC
jgi:hypothetical protein